MDAIVSWVKPILYFSIFLTLLLQLLPNDTYKKYIQFFAGLLMIVLVMRPVLNLFQEEDFSEKIFSETFYQEYSEEIDLEVEELEEGKQLYYESLIQESGTQDTHQED